MSNIFLRNKNRQCHSFLAYIFVSFFLMFSFLVGTVLLHCPHLSGLDFSKNCVFSVLGKEFFSRHILSKNLNWESGVIWKCGPTRLIFAQVLVHSQIIWHCSMTHDPCPCSCPRSWPSYMFSCTWNNIVLGNFVQGKNCYVIMNKLFPHALCIFSLL